MDDAHSDESSYVFVPSNLSSTQISHFKILSLNCFCSVPQPIRFTGLHARADRFAEVIYPHRRS